MADKVLFAELAMLGEFREIREPLLRLRFHAGRTFQANTTRRALRVLFAPHGQIKGGLLSVQSQAQVELIRSAYLIPSVLTEKLLCASVASTIPYWCRFKNFGGRQKIKLRRLLGI